MKYQEEIDYLKKQVKELQNLQKNKKQVETITNHCNVCCNGEVIEHMKNMLNSVESDHRECLTQKMKWNARILELQQKLEVLEEESKYEIQKYRKAKDENRRLKHDLDIF